MGLTCRLLRHAPDGERWNEGWFFARCRRCGGDLFRGEGAWTPVPQGHRVAWKTGYHRHSLPSDFGRNMPIEAGPVRTATPGVMQRLFWRRPLALPGPDTAEMAATGPNGLLLAAVTLLGVSLPWLRRVRI